MPARSSDFAALLLLTTISWSVATSPEDAVGSAAASQCAATLGTRLRSIINEQAGGTVAARLPTGAPPLTDSDRLLAASHRLSARLDTAQRLLESTRQAILDAGDYPSYIRPCPLSSVNKVYRKDERERSNELQPSEPVVSSENSTDLKIKRQHFLSAADGATVKNCRLISDDSRLRKLFHQYFQPTSKQIIIIIDNQNTSSELYFALSIASEIINYLSPADKIGILTNSDCSRDCLQLLRNCTIQSSPVGFATDNNKRLLTKFISNLNTSDPLDVPATFDKAIGLFDDDRDAMILYIGSESLNFTQFRPNRTIIVNICTLSNDFNKADLPDCTGNITDGLCAGMYVQFNSSLSIAEAASHLLLTLIRKANSDEIAAATPVWDPVQRDLLVPLVLPCADRGILVFDLYLADIAQDVIYFNPASDRHRAFIIDMSGNVIMHSSYSRPEVITTKPRLVDISLIETPPQFESVRSLLLTSSDGTKIVQNGSISITYTWKWIKKLFVICIVSEIDAQSNNITDYVRRISSHLPQELQYHRIDLLPTNGGICRHFKQVSTIDKGTLYLSPSSFQSPFRYLHDIRNGKDISFKMLQACMAYLKDNTRLLSNPGLKPEIRSDVVTLYQMLNYYKRQHIHGSYNKYIVRRYAVTDHGVLVMFPGSILESDYEPNRKAWFTKSIQNPRRIILTPPYLDVGGAGYIITISFAPQELPERIRPNVVVALDITMGFLYKMLVKSLNLCTEANVKCFLMDDQGYLLTHPSLFDRRVSGPIEQQHITHKESLITNDMLHHKGFVQKQLCKNFMDGTLQRFYKFNMSISNVFTNFISGDHCARYFITAVEGTNMFLGIVNSSSDVGAFCPCSITDRVCLNCNRMEQNECECPCECTLPDRNVCLPINHSVPICELQPEKNNHKNHYFYNLATHLKSCFDFQCDSYRSESTCMGVLGCEWCHIDFDGDSLLSTPFCAAQSACFSGVIGAVTPYGEGSLGHVIQDDVLATYSAVGPIAGCIVAVCLILAVAVYCYKQNSMTNTIGNSYVGTAPETWPDVGVQLSHLNSEDDIHDDRSGQQDKLLVNDLVVPISPYRVLTGYRRPNTTGESDHGYSTMTPHDDSEHMAFALMEPSGEANASENASSSPAPSTRAITDAITILPCGKNNVIAPVTVHRNMEAT